MIYEFVFIGRSGEPFPYGSEIYALPDSLEPLNHSDVDADLWALLRWQPLGSFGGERRQILGFVKNHTRQRVELALPRLARQHCLRVRVACFPTPPDSGLAEIDVLGVIVMVQLRREQLDHMHAGLAAIAQQCPDLRVAALAFR